MGRRGDRQSATREQTNLLVRRVLHLPLVPCDGEGVLFQSSDRRTIQSLVRFIKVDREEHPEIDNEYMSFVEATTGSGGWPMNVFLTPDLKPFFGGT
jgi:hypothetical protein